MALDSDHIEINRRENARILAKRTGSKARFAERIDRSPGQVGQIIGKTPTKNIGKDLARHIEMCFKKPKFWLDQDHSPGVEEPPVEYDARDLHAAIEEIASYGELEMDRYAKDLINALASRNRRLLLRALLEAELDDLG